MRETFDPLKASTKYEGRGSLDDPEQLMYITMLDHVVYDCWITQVIYHTTEEQFLTLYSYNSKDRNIFLNRLATSSMKSALVKRNEFHLRHKELVKNIKSPLNVYKARSLEQLLRPIFEKMHENIATIPRNSRRETIFSPQPTALQRISSSR